MKKPLQDLGLLCAGLLAGLFAAEGAGRIVYTRPWYEQLVQEQGPNFGMTSIRLNSWGLRDRDYSVTKPARCKRVLLLGDSFTFGVGVPDDAAIFPELLERRLNAQAAQRGTTVEILNGGLPGSLSEDWVALLRRVGRSFRPDLIVIVFFLRDGTRTSTIGGFFGPVRDEIVARNSSSYLYQRFYLFRLYQDHRDRLRISRDYARVFNDSYFGTVTQTEEWRLAQSNIRQIKAIGEDAKAKVALVVFPALVELNDQYPFKEISDVIARYGREQGLPTHELLPAFMGKDASRLWVSTADQHPNAVGHAIAVESLLPFLGQLLRE